MSSTYANEPADMAAVINALPCYDAALQCDAWFEWVPSAANVADLPSRRRGVGGRRVVLRRHAARRHAAAAVAVAGRLRVSLTRRRSPWRRRGGVRRV